MRIPFPAIAAAATFAFCVGAAHADTLADGSRAITRGRSVVHYGDLNLATERDAKIMLLRIDGAARKACGGHATFSAYTGSLDRTFEECRDMAVQRAVKLLGAPVVTRLYSEVKRRES